MKEKTNNEPIISKGNTENETIQNGLKKSRIIKFICCIIILTVLFFIVIYSIPTNIEKVKDSVVMIETYDKQGNKMSTGSGFCVYESNYIATNYHVIEGAYSIKIIDDNQKEYPIEEIKIFNKKNDLAILQGDFKLSPLKIKKTNNIKAGDAIKTISSPKGVLNTVSNGIISNADEEYAIRITAPISPR